MRLFQKYVCEICNSAYDKEEHAKQCEVRGIEELKIKVGDIVYIDLVKHDQRMNHWWQGKVEPEGYLQAQVMGIRGPFGNFPASGLPCGIIGEPRGFNFFGLCFWGYGPSSHPHVYLFQVRLDNFDKPINNCDAVRNTYLQSELFLEKPEPSEALAKKSFFTRLFRK